MISDRLMRAWRVLRWILMGLGSFFILVLLGMTVYALPASLSLPRGTRPGLEDLTLTQAADRLRASSAQGWELVEQARQLVGERMAYCRRNSFDPAPRAFRRGYGYCQQHAYALTGLLHLLGFEARVVQAFRNRFADGQVSGHAWVRVTFDDQIRDIDPLFADPATGELLFESLSPVTGMSPLFSFFAQWGAASANAYRYYRTGSDTTGNY